MVRWKEHPPQHHLAPPYPALEITRKTNRRKRYNFRKHSPLHHFLPSYPFIYLYLYIFIDTLFCLFLVLLLFDAQSLFWPTTLSVLFCHAIFLFFRAMQNSFTQRAQISSNLLANSTTPFNWICCYYAGQNFLKHFSFYRIHYFWSDLSSQCKKIKSPCLLHAVLMPPNL